RRQRRLFGGLQHHRVAREECRSELPGTDYEWIVPRDYRGNDTEWLTAHQRELMRGGRCNFVINFVRKLGVIGNTVGSKRHIHVDRVENRLAHIQCFENRQPVDVVTDQLREPLQRALSSGGVGMPPGACVEGRACCCNCSVHVCRAAPGNLGHHTTVDGADVVENPAVEGFVPLAVDECTALGPCNGGKLLPICAGACGARCGHHSLSVRNRWARYSRSESSTGRRFERRMAAFSGRAICAASCWAVMPSWPSPDNDTLRPTSRISRSIAAGSSVAPADSPIA